ncbi:MAG: hypothetical protein IJZ88_03705 [Clostridia bacterium]|nr:hypothetical protein [Clostridia bacterium]
MFQQIASFFFMLNLLFNSLFCLPLNRYNSMELFSDDDFSDGFFVVSQATVNGQGQKLGSFTYCNESSVPSWAIAQWNSGPCLWADRIESDRYTLTDGTTKTVTYNPQEGCVSMRLNAANVYNGSAATYENWPHLLLEQAPLTDYDKLTDEEKEFYFCTADEFVLDLKIRMTDFKHTTNPEGVNAVQFLAYFYLQGFSGNEFIWFGVDLFDSRGYSDTNWSYDKGSGNMIYCLSTKDTYGLKTRSLYRFGKPYISEEWTTVKVNLKPHLEKAIKLANEDNIFGKEVSLEDFYIGGTNIGFEIHGNYDCTMEIKDFNITSYKKK